MPAAIKVENLSKAYQLGEIGTGTISRDLERWFAKVRGKEDPFLKIGETNDRATKGASDVVWSLKDINFEIQQGDAVGIIGRNGAGKSTLLKILSRVTAPTTGKIKVKGRIASLLEVGTGFHPELTGRENIFLNGAILGMRKKEIARKFDEIVDFAGVERYIDTPVKRYSSGMYVRLAFAVAAYLESEILIVDEVLAVGDAEFQKKCLGKMGEVSKGEGRTVLFVTHNLTAIQELCSTSLFLEEGSLAEQNETYKILSSYLKKASYTSYIANSARINQEIYVNKANLNNNILKNGSIEIELEVISKIEIAVSIDFRIYSGMSIPVAFSSIGTLNYNEQIQKSVGTEKFACKIDISNLAIGEYIVSIDVTQPNIKYYDRCEDCLSFEILKNEESDRHLNQNWNYGFINLPISMIR